MITNSQYKQAADFLRVEPALIKAVAEVESSGSGFLPDKSLKILFEPHIFWEQLQKAGINPKLHTKGNTDILYPKWKRGAYGKESAQWGRLRRAAIIHKEVAYKSASWGKFQPMGIYHQECGFKTVMQMVTVFMLGENEHLTAFIKMIRYRNLDLYLREKDFAGFAKRYNGSGYDDAPGRENDYDVKIEKKFLQFSEEEYI